MGGRDGSTPPTSELRGLRGGEALAAKRHLDHGSEPEVAVVANRTYNRALIMPVLSLATLCLAAPVGYAGLRAVPKRAGHESLEASAPSRTSRPPTHGARASGTVRALLWAVSSAAVLAAPWGLPRVPVLRFVVAVCSVLAFMRLTETWLGKVAAVNTRRFSDYLWYFTFFGDVRQHPSGERGWGREMGLKRLGRAAAKGIALLALFALATVFPELWSSFILRSVWCLWAGYVGATGAADAISGLQMVVSGHGCAETFVVPVVARSPGDFWGRRWNLVFRNASHRVLFQRVARRFGASTAGATVFLWSIVAHEYLVVAALGRTGGEMALFFGLQGAMTLLLSKIGRGQPWPTFVAVGAHWLWMIATAPLFFMPILQVFPADQWRLW